MSHQRAFLRGLIVVAALAGSFWAGRQSAPVVAPALAPPPAVAPVSPVAGERLGARESGAAGPIAPDQQALDPKVADLLKELTRQMQTDPAGALAALARLPIAVRAQVAPAVLLYGVDRDAAACADWMLRHLPGRALVTAVQPFAQRWASQAPMDAARWLAAQREDESDLLLPFFAEALAAKWQAAAPNHLLQLPVSESRNHLINAVLLSWASTSPESAVHWALAHTAQVPRAMAAALNAWAGVNPDAAQRWLASQPPSAARDQGYAGLSDRVAETDAATSIVYASAIGEASLRLDQQRSLLANWLAEDRPAAEDWMAKDTTLSGELKREVLAGNLEAESPAIAIPQTAPPASAP